MNAKSVSGYRNAHYTEECLDSDLRPFSFKLPEQAARIKKEPRTLSRYIAKCGLGAFSGTFFPWKSETVETSLSLDLLFGRALALAEGSCSIYCPPACLGLSDVPELVELAPP